MNGMFAETSLRQWILYGVGVMVPVVLIIASYQVYRHHRYKHFAIHDPGKVYRSAWVDADVFEELIEKYHVHTVLNLCYPGEMGDRNIAQREAVEGAGAKLIEVEFPPNDTWEVDYPAVAEVEKILDDPENYPLWVHCQHGRERTVKVLAMYDIRKRNLTAKSSLEPMPRFDLDHPWPIVVFAFNYETLMEQRQLADYNDACEIQADQRSDDSTSGTSLH